MTMQFTKCLNFDKTPFAIANHAKITNCKNRQATINNHKHNNYGKLELL